MSIELFPFFTLALVGVMATSCEQNELEEVVSTSAVNVENAISGNLLINETFESGSGLTAFQSDDFAASHSFTLVSNPAFADSKAARFELRDSDPMVSNGTRAEVTVVKDETTPEMTKEMWYSFAVFFPTIGYEADAEKEIISQWHQSGGESPPISLIIQNDQLNIEVRNKIGEKNYFPLGSVIKDKWQQFTFHIIHSKGTDGIVEIYNNGTKIFTFKGANLYEAGDDLPKWKMGIYKWKWNGTETTNTHKRVLYYDNVRAGISSASLTEMTAGGSTSTSTSTTTTTTTDPISTTTTTAPTTTTTTTTTSTSGNYFTFVNASTDTDVKTVSNGSSLSQSAIGTEKVNIRYNSAAIPAGGSVKFELSGSKSHTYADNAAPYAMFGDDGSGNYYYGSGLPVGQYTLTATPYSGQKGTGTAGTPVSVSFSIVK
jgi:hypothetical protein